jgi:flagellar motor switch protein FliM
MADVLSQSEIDALLSGLIYRRLRTWSVQEEEKHKLNSMILRSAKILKGSYKTLELIRW